MPTADTEAFWQGVWKEQENRIGARQSVQSSDSVRESSGAPRGTSAYVSRRPTTSTLSSAESSCPLWAVLLSLWDNVTGPRVEHAWLLSTDGDESSLLSRLTVVAKHTLSGTLDGGLVLKFIAGDCGGSGCDSAAPLPLAWCVTFPSPYLESAPPTKFSLCVLLRNSQANARRAASLHATFDDRLLWLAVLAREAYSRARDPASALECLGGGVRFVAEELGRALQRCPQTVAETPRTEWLMEGTEEFGRSVARATLAHGVEFLGRVVTSHLQTGGRSIVIGWHRQEVASLVSVLRPFCGRDELACSVSEPSEDGSLFPSLALQGIVLSQENAPLVEAALARIMESPAPVSVVEVTPDGRGTVYHTPRGRAEFAELRKRYVMSTLDSLVVTQSPSVRPTAAPVSTQFSADGTATHAVTEVPGRADSRAPHVSLVRLAASKKAEWMPKGGLLSLVYSSGPTGENADRRQHSRTGTAPEDGSACNSPMVFDLCCQLNRLPQQLRLPHAMFAYKLYNLKATTLIRLIDADSGHQNQLTSGSRQAVLAAQDGKTETGRNDDSPRVSANEMPSAALAPGSASLGPQQQKAARKKDKISVREYYGLARWLKENLGLVCPGDDKSYSSTGGNGVPGALGPSSEAALTGRAGSGSDADLSVVLALAEKIRPGISAILMAERVTLEEKFIELLQGFV